jgi:multisubunit Na+/H+ antiporter MnhC subunit
MYLDIKDRDDTAEYAAAQWLPELIWVIPAGLCALGYYLLDLRGWMLALFVAMSIAATACFASYFLAGYRERRAASRKQS